MAVTTTILAYFVDLLPQVSDNVLPITSNTSANSIVAASAQYD
ncbi:MAG TPA: hypothetical protein VGE82_01905 [Nitrososphaera sp.]|jgi:hypothetical protein